MAEKRSLKRFLEACGTILRPKVAKMMPKEAQSGPKNDQKTRSRFGPVFGRPRGGCVGDWEPFLEPK